MKTKPILFSTPMVQAILDGRKTQTRRTTGFKEINADDPDKYLVWGLKENGKITVDDLNSLEDFEIKLPYGNIGDILWVRETFRNLEETSVIGAGSEKYKNIKYWYKTDNVGDMQVVGGKWKPSIFMPKEACRIFLEVTNVRVERLNGICEKDSIAEGVVDISIFSDLYLYQCFLCPEKGHKGGNEMCEDGYFDNAFESFRSLWKSINGEESWEENPWVFVYDFKQVERPKNFLK